MWCPVFWQGQKDTNPLFGGFALLDDQNLVDFGTRLRTLHLKNSPPDYFSGRCKPTLGSSLSIFQVKIKTTIRVDGHLYFGRGRRTWTLGTRFWSKSRLQKPRVGLYRVLSLSCKFSIGGVQQHTAIKLLIADFSESFRCFWAGQGELSLPRIHHLQPLNVTLHETKMQVSRHWKRLQILYLKHIKYHSPNDKGVYHRAGRKYIKQK